MAARKASPLPADAGTPASIVEAAEEEIRAADEHAAALEAAARGGDDTVTADDVDAAHKNARWARIRRDAAQVKAKALAEELAREAHRSILAEHLDTALSDPSAQIGALLDQARPFLEQAIGLIADHNRAVYQLAKHASDPAAYKDPEQGFMGHVTHRMPATAWIEHDGRKAAFLPSTEIIARLLRPLKSQALAASGGISDEFLERL